LALGLLAILGSAPRSDAASGPEIDASVRATLNQFFHEVWSSRELANQAVAILVFPTIVKAGFGIGGEYGEGALHVRGRTAGYFNIISGSIGFQLGAQARSVIIMFMTESALAGFQSDSEQVIRQLSPSLRSPYVLQSAATLERQLPKPDHRFHSIRRG
jgi:lipid-binding SYLF domain-containing protein